jgi:hypothetical protein
LAAGEGELITGRFMTRQVDRTVLMTFSNGEQLEGTTLHPIWSPDRQEWVPMSDFEVGDAVLSQDGQLTIREIGFRYQTVPVYNIEVRGEHVYEVTGSGILVHNAGQGNYNVPKAGNAPNIVKPLTQSEQAAIRKIGNIEKGHLTPGDFTGSLRDVTGNPVPKPGGGFWDHAQEMNNSLRGLRNAVEKLKDATDPVGVAAREKAMQLIQQILDHTAGAGI